MVERWIWELELIMKRFFALLLALACLPAMAGQPYVVNPGGTATNFTWYNRGALLSSNINLTLTRGSVQGQANGGILAVNSGTNSFTMAFGDAVGTAGSLTMNAGHGGTPLLPQTYEVTLLSPGPIALVPGAGQTAQPHIQLGAGQGQYWAFWQNGGFLGTPNNLGYSGMQAWRTTYLENGNQHDRYPGILSQALSTNGLYELTFFTDRNGVITDGWTIGQVNSTRIMGLYDGGPGRQRGVNLRGGIVQERAAGIALSNCPLDFGTNYCADLAVSSIDITLRTTNTLAGATNYESRVFILRAGMPTTIRYPIGATGWNLRTNLPPPPTNLVAGQYMRIELEAMGLGETNIGVKDWAVYTDNSFVLDADAAGFISRAAITDPVQKSAINRLVVQLKAASLWTKKDIIYPFVGGSATPHSKNLKANTFNITWNGTVTHDATGVTGNGSTGYGATGFNPSTAGGAYSLNSAHVFCYSGSASATANRAIVNTASGGGTDEISLELGPDTTSWRTIGLNASETISIGVVDARGPVLVTRTASNVTVLYILGNSITGSAASVSMVNLDVDILRRTFGGNDRYSDCNIRGITIGSGESAADWANEQIIWNEFEAMLGRKAP